MASNPIIDNAVAAYISQVDFLLKCKMVSAERHQTLTEVIEGFREFTESFELVHKTQVVPQLPEKFVEEWPKTGSSVKALDKVVADKRKNYNSI